VGDNALIQSAADQPSTPSEHVDDLNWALNAVQDEWDCNIEGRTCPTFAVVDTVADRHCVAMTRRILTRILPR
jgi:hypothetical protein